MWVRNKGILMSTITCLFYFEVCLKDLESLNFCITAKLLQCWTKIHSSAVAKQLLPHNKCWNLIRTIIVSQQLLVSKSHPSHRYGYQPLVVDVTCRHIHHNISLQHFTKKYFFVLWIPEWFWSEIRYSNINIFNFQICFIQFSFKSSIIALSYSEIFFFNIIIKINRF